jgi:putative Mg2+ transporter-C (MgtC) family protein
MYLIETIIRIIITALLAFFFGYARQKHHKPIGFGAFIFVSTGACGLAITGIMLSPENPLPILSAIVTGIGFLGAGALIKTNDKISGFTNASSVWIFAVFGLFIGVGEYIIAGIVYIMIWLVFFFDKYLEKRGIGSFQKKIFLATTKIISEHEIESTMVFGSIKLKKMNIEVNKKNNTLYISYLIQGTREDINRIPQRLYEKPWFEAFKVE